MQHLYTRRLATAMGVLLVALAALFAWLINA